MHDLTTAPQQPSLPAVPVRMELTVADLKRRQDLIQEAIRAVMVEGHHFGTIPGTTDKKTLHKPGAEKLCALFMLAPAFTVQVRELPEGHREYRADCTLTHIATGIVAGMAIGSCSTMESKYRWRLGSRKCPSCNAEAIRKAKDGGGGFYCWAKIGGCGAKFAEGDKAIISQELGRVPNPDIADQYNTCLKMATKRALVAAVLLVTAASDALIAEEEDGDDEHEPEPKPRHERKASTPRQTPPTELTPRQRALKECVSMAEALLKAGRTKDDLSALLGKQGVIMPPKWGDLQDAELDIVRQAFAEELKTGTPVQQ